jgi:hypothetical protein
MLAFTLDQIDMEQIYYFGLKLKEQFHTKSPIIDEISLSSAYSVAINEGTVLSQKKSYTFSIKASGLYFLEFEHPQEVWSLKRRVEIGD